MKPPYRKNDPLGDFLFGACMIFAVLAILMMIVGAVWQAVS